MSIKEYWDELNKMYGLDLEMPEIGDFDAEQFVADLINGSSIDAAFQRDME